MKERMLTGWTLSRVLYTAGGLLIIINSLVDRQWFGIVFGVYFASMGIFAFGCAAGNCYTGRTRTQQQSVSGNALPEVQFEEVKTKKDV